MSEIVEVATGLSFPEGPVWLPDGSVLVVEVRPGNLTRVRADGTVEVVAHLGGGPNGAALGPDGAVYVANNGGLNFDATPERGLAVGHDTTPPGFAGGWIDRVDLITGDHQVLYRECGEYRFRGPNDLVFDATGGFWFTDFGKQRAFDLDRGGLFYARADGTGVVQAPVFLLGPNGVGLSPDGSRIYVAETHTGRLLAWDLEAPGVVKGRRPDILVATKGGFDSLAVEADGTIVVAALRKGLCVVSPDGERCEYVDMPDTMTTNLAFGGDDLRTAYVTLSASGALVSTRWPRPGLRLAY
jgi:gluconolactonase